MKKHICIAASVMLCAAVLMSVCPISAQSAPATVQAAAGSDSGYSQSPDGNNNGQITVSFEQNASRIQSTAAPVKAEGLGTVCLMENGSSASFRVSVAADAVYNLSLVFGNVSETAEEYDFSLTIDGKLPFENSQKLKLNALWEDDGEIRKIANGDEVNPAQKHTEGKVSQVITDWDGLALTPYEFSLSAGEHIITVNCLNEAFYLCGIALTAPQSTESYDAVSAGYSEQDYYTGKQIVIEAESPFYKNAYDLIARSDTGSAAVSPNSPAHSVLNYIGGSTWSEPGQEITWEVDIPETGLYKIGFSFKQNSINNGKAYRTLKIDGKVPFEEAMDIGFSYATKWQFVSMQDDGGDDCLLRLEKGKHTLSLAVTLSDIAVVYQKLNEIVTPLGSMYLDMAMITGENPDSNRDYQLHKQIPDFTGTLASIQKNCDALYAEIGTSLQANGELRGALKNMSRILTNMQKNLYQAHLQIPTYYTAYQTLSSWLNDLKNMALNLDRIVIAAPGVPFESASPGFFDSLKFGTMRFLYSYTGEYSKVANGDDDSQPTIKIWVNWGRDQVKVLNTLIQDSFVRKNKVNVLVEQVNATLVQGVVSGNSPDLYLHMARTEPVNLAMRGVLYDLKNFKDYEDTLSGFMPGAQTPYLYHDGCYALPDTQSFYVMFSRNDILDELGVAVPDTWDEFLSATGILQRNNMNTYLPYTKITAATTVNTGAGGLSVFPTMLLQRGGSVYNDTVTASRLASTPAVQGFTFWTDFYTKYSLDQDANFYQKFRVGTIPLGIAVYTQYLTFKVAAPEIDGKWTIAQIPGIRQEDGSVNRVCSGAGTGCSIMKSSKNKEAAWAFLKWWVGADTQYRYSAENEAILGETGRTPSATVDAVSKLSWDRDALAVIMQQWNQVSEIPEAPGSYFVSRSIDQAFWAVKNGKSSPKKAITDWTEICDKEIERKIKEYSGEER